MSNSESDTGNVRLVADGGEPGTEIFVIDGRFNLAKRGLGRLEADLRPGLYKVKFKRGSSEAEIDAVLFPGTGTVSVAAPKLAFSTPAPLQGTDTSHEYHQEAAQRISCQAPAKVGAGSQLFAFARDVETPGVGNPATGLTLHDLRGRKLLDLAEISEHAFEHDSSMAAWAGCNVELDPGEYRLRVATGTGRGLEQTIVLSPGWQTQVFLVRDWYETLPPDGVESASETPGSEAQSKCADLSKSTILMAPIGAGFSANDDQLRLTELARQGLTTGRAVVTVDDLKEMVNRKFENPMLGIYGAHLLLPALRTQTSRESLQADDVVGRRASSAVRAIQQVAGVTADGIAGPSTMATVSEVLRTLIGHLKSILGDHLDVRALELQLDRNIGGNRSFPPFHAPPMLKLSWEIVVAASAAEPTLIPPGSLTDRIADRLWGSGAWLVWQVPPFASKRIRANPIGQLEDILGKIAHSVSDSDSFEQLLRQSGVNNLEESLLRYAVRRIPVGGARAQKAPNLSYVGELGSAEGRLKLALPASTLDRAAQSLAQKLKKVVGSS